MPLGLEFVLVLASLSVIVFVAFGLGLIIKLWRNATFLDRAPKGRLTKEAHHV